VATDGITIAATASPDAAPSVNISGTVLTNISSQSIDVSGATAGNEVAIDNIEVDDGSGSGTGINIGAQVDFTVTDAVINDTNDGINVGSSDDLGVISNATITNLGATAIDLDDPTNTDTKIDINQTTSVDQATRGIDIGHAVNYELKLDITDVTINGTTGAVNVTNMNSSATSNNKFTVNSSTFTNNTVGFALGDLTDGNVDSSIDINLNTFEDNRDAVVVDDSDDSQEFQGSIVLHFNDIVSSTDNGLEILKFPGRDSGGIVNAKYNYWDDSTGPRRQRER
jgi:hypothetical protein